jgi:hypothetical protein
MDAVAIHWLWLAVLHDGGVGDRVETFLLAVLDAKERPLTKANSQFQLRIKADIAEFLPAADAGYTAWRRRGLYGLATKS